MDPLVPNQVRYRTAPHSEDQNYNGWDPNGQGPAGDFYELPESELVNLPSYATMGAFMNATSTTEPRRTRLMTGIAVSIALHAALLLAWRQSARAPEVPAPASIAVWLRPPPPPKVEPAPATSPSSAKSARAAPRRHVPANVIALPAGEAVRPDAFTVEPPQPEPPHFDLEAARRTARKVANEQDPAKAGTPLAQFPEKPLETETRAARAISKAKRRDCKDGVPGGLLAPLILLMDKKDSGCKW